MVFFKISFLELFYMFVFFVGVFEMFGYNLLSCIYIYFVKWKIIEIKFLFTYKNSKKWFGMSYVYIIKN